MLHQKLGAAVLDLHKNRPVKAGMDAGRDRGALPLTTDPFAATDRFGKRGVITFGFSPVFAVALVKINRSQIELKSYNSGKGAGGEVGEVSHYRDVRG